MTGLRFGLMTYDAAPWEELTRRWRGHEDAGFDALWAGDHLWSACDDAGATTRPRLDAWMMAAGMAASTRRVDVGTLVSPMGRHNPAVLAKQALTLDHMSGGRAVAGIGSGGNAADLAVAGGEAVPARERAPRLAEYARVVRAVLDGSREGVDGVYHRTHGPTAPGPVRPGGVRLLVAAHGPAALRAAAPHADVWNSYGTPFSQLGGDGPPSAERSLRRTAELSRVLDRECERIGRDPASVARSFMLAFTRDEPWTSVEAFRDTVGRYADIGITEFVFPFPLRGPHDPDVFAEVVADVLPRLRAGERP